MKILASVHKVFNLVVMKTLGLCHLFSYQGADRALVKLREHLQIFICRCLSCAGIATLELAVMMVVLLGIFLGGTGLVDYLDRVRLAHQIAERVLGDSGVRPLYWNPAAATVSLDSSEIDTYVAGAVGGLDAAFLKAGLSSSMVFAEVKVCPLAMNPVSGEFQSIIGSECRSASTGTLVVSATMLTSTDFVPLFTAEAARSLPPAAGQSGAPSLLAQPSGLFGWQSQSYLPLSVVAGLRVFISLSGSLAGAAYAQLGEEPILYASRVVHLRGSVK